MKRFIIEPLTIDVSDPVKINLNSWWHLSVKGFGQYSQLISHAVYCKLIKSSHAFCIEDEFEKKYLLVVKKIDTECVLSITPMMKNNNDVLIR